MFRDGCGGSKCRQNINEPEKVYLQVWSGHGPFHHPRIPKTDVERGEIIICEISEYTLAKFEYSRVQGI
jgi:hypothetical protein